MIETPVHPFGKDRFGLVEIARHPGILRAAAGEHEDDLRVGSQSLVGKDAAGIGGLQQARGLFVGFGDDNAPLVEGAAAFLQREGHIGQRLVGSRAQMRGKCGGIGVKRGAAAPRDAEHLEGPVAVFGRGQIGGFLEDGVGIGATHPQRIDPGPARGRAPGPVGQPVVDPER